MSERPWTHLEIDGGDAMATWRRLRAEARGWPILVGGDEAYEFLCANASADPRTSADILLAARSVDLSRIGEDNEGGISVAEFMSVAVGSTGDLSSLPPDFASTFAMVAAKTYEPPTLRDPSLAFDYHGRPLAKVHLLVLSGADDGSQVPAFLRWGGWNACPKPEQHVARLKDWNERFGAELVGLSHATMNLHVARPPKQKDEAACLAREHIAYCPDSGPQAPETVESYAGDLLGREWWTFWWD